AVVEREREPGSLRERQRAAELPPVEDVAREPVRGDVDADAALLGLVDRLREARVGRVAEPVARRVERRAELGVRSGDLHPAPGRGERRRVAHDLVAELAAEPHGPEEGPDLPRTGAG